MSLIWIQTGLSSEPMLFGSKVAPFCVTWLFSTASLARAALSTMSSWVVPDANKITYMTDVEGHRG